MLDSLRTLFQEPLAFFDQAIFRVLAVLIALVVLLVALLVMRQISAARRRRRPKAGRRKTR